ncbi:MAG TPA: copper amine oxidase N-terminal domain-containing protein [Candidatus Elarobacter sp.]
MLAVLLSASAAHAQTAEFGNPPSGEYPILYNDHTVYATPDVLKQNRVLAALVKNGRIYVPLRSMFEQMGATVSATPDGKTVTASKPGASVVVTVGKPEVVVNGESRPLDVPPIVYHGIVLVPVRVISEAMGAYVQWVPDKRVVVVRYISLPAPTPTPVPAATPSPSLVPAAVSTPSPSPSPAPTPGSYQAFVQAAFSAPKTYNEFSAGEWCRESYIVSGAWAPKNSPFAVKIDFRQDSFVTSDNVRDNIGNHYTQFDTIDGGVALTPVFLGRQTNLDARLEYAVAAPRVYVGVSYIHTENNYGYPQLNGIGAGVEKLPDLRPGLSFFGSAFYYPTVSGNYTILNAASANAGKSYRQQYQMLKYDVGLAYDPGRSRLYVYGGIAGDRFTAKQNAPIGQTHDGPYLGLGLKI